MPATRIVIGRDRIVDTALDLTAQHKGAQQIGTGTTSVLCEREQCWGQWSARVGDRVRMIVVVVADVGHHCIDERGERGITALAVPQDRPGRPPKTA